MPYRSIFPALTVSPEMFPIVNEEMVVVGAHKVLNRRPDEMAAKLVELLKQGGYIQ